MKTLLQNILARKTLVALGIVIVGGGGYAIYHAKQAASTTQVQYVTQPATKGLLVVSVGASGQVLTQDELEVKPLVSGKIQDLKIKQGDLVQQGQVLAEVDQTEALKTVRDHVQAVRDAQNALAASRLSLAKLKQPADAAALLQAQNALNQAKRDLETLTQPADPLDVQSAQADVTAQEYTLRMSGDGTTPQMVRDKYDDFVPLLNSTLLFLQNGLIDADNILGIDNSAANARFQAQLSSFNKGYRQQAESDYGAAKRAIAATKLIVSSMKPKNEDIAVLARAEGASRDALVALSVVLKDVREALLHTPPSPTFSQSEIDGLRSSIQSDLSLIDTKTSSFVTQEQAVDQAKSSYDTAKISLQKMQIALQKLQKGAEQRGIDAAREKIAEREQALADIKKGADATDLALAQNTVDQRVAALLAAQSKLSDVQKALADYHVLSPFTGVIVTVPARKGDGASPSTVLATLATQQKIAQISLNEVDVTKVKVGQKVTLTFDAIEDLSIVGTVLQIDQAGTVTQGVVNYGVKIGLDTADERVRSGMSVAASIIVNSKIDVLVVPNAAVKQQNSQTTVDVLTAGAKTPTRTSVRTGIANDTETEIISGINEGDEVVVQTITAAATAPATAANAQLRIPGLTGGIGGGGNFRGGTGGVGR